MTVSLFDERYKGRFSNSEEYWGFVKGVECAINHMNLALGNVEASKSMTA